MVCHEASVAIRKSVIELVEDNLLRRRKEMEALWKIVVFEKLSVLEREVTKKGYFHDPDFISQKVRVNASEYFTLATNTIKMSV